MTAKRKVAAAVRKGGVKAVREAFEAARPRSCAEALDRLPFRVGDVVRLKSGGHPMVVTMREPGGLIGVSWSRGGTCECDEFDAACLEKTRPDDIPF